MTNRNVYTSDTSTSTVISAVTDAVITTVSVGATTGPLAMTPDGSKVYMTHIATLTEVTVIATASNTVLAHITMPGTVLPGSVAITPDGTKAVVAGNDPSNHIWVVVIDTASNTVIHSLDLSTVPITTGPFQNGSQGVLISPDGLTAYIACYGSGGVAGANVAFYTIATNTVPHVATPNGHSLNLALSHDGSTLYSFDGTDQSVGVIATATAAVTTNIAVADNPNNGVISPDGASLYVSDSSHIVVIATATNTVTHSIALVGANVLFGPAVKLDGSQVYFPDFSINHLLRILDTSAFTVSTLLLTNRQGDCRISVNGDKLYVPTNGTTTVIATSSNTVLATPSGAVSYLTAGYVGPPPPSAPSYPGALFIPHLFIPQKGKVDRSYTAAELMANWLAIENWSQRWRPPAPTLFIPRKGSDAPRDLDTNWVTLKVWADQIHNLGAPYPPLIIPRMTSNDPTDLDVDFLAVQNWANLIARG